MGMKMVRMLWVLMVVLCSSCMQLHVPDARVEFTSIKHQGYGQYELRFRSDRDVANIYKSNGINDGVNAWIMCSLDGDRNFSNNHTMTLSMQGFLEDAHLVEGDRRYEFWTSVRFTEGSDHHRAQREIRKEVLLPLLKSQEYIPCKTVSVAWFFKPYYSTIMYIPTSRIIAEVDKQILSPAYVILPPEDRPFSWLLFEPVCINEWVWNGGETIVHGGVCSSLPYSGLLSSFAPYKDKYRVVNQETGLAIPDAPYIIVRMDGRKEEGVTDSLGYTHQVGADEPETIKLYVPGEGP
ncbi:MULTISPECIES: hypothetical protein [unclassified Pseudomonas]|uniref:hypothetical protein n=1 Tax=unclassified Pseudomonas TaxID=196821 RepID=UPI0011AFA6D4|nr:MULTISPECIES: hypothetical protein [unclassified Pseudomonas]